MKNKQYLLGIGVLVIGVLLLEQVLDYLNITESYLFLVFWIVFFIWILFGKRFLIREKNECDRNLRKVLGYMGDLAHYHSYYYLAIT